jgi:hypothetical protein
MNDIQQKNCARLILPNQIPVSVAQTGDKNTSIAHADNLTVNNIFQITSLPIAPSNDTVTWALPRQKKDEPKTSRSASFDFYNLFVGGSNGYLLSNNRILMHKDRCLKGQSAIDAKYAILDEGAIEEIKTFPSLFMEENTMYDGRTNPEQEAIFGFITGIKLQQNEFVCISFNPVSKINQQKLNYIAVYLDLYTGKGLTELNHTHWSIKNINLFEELIKADLLPDVILQTWS